MIDKVTAHCPCGWIKRGSKRDTIRALNDHANECARWDYDDEPRYHTAVACEDCNQATGA